MKKELKKKAKKPTTTVTGQKVDTEIDVRPRKDMNEAREKHAVLTFGRMNPPTIGHMALVQKIIKVARSKSAQPLIYLSHSQDAKKNPLSYDEKLRLAQAAFGKRLVVKSNARTIIEVLKQLQRSFTDITVVVGSDRVPEFERIVKTYNGRDFKFKSVNVVSAGTRDPDSDGVAGMSASKMRDMAAKNNLNQFKRGLPPQLQSMSDMIMGMVRNGMKLQEELEELGLNQLDEVLTLQQRRKKALVMRRYKNKIKISRERQRRRMADTGRLRKRAARAAIRLIRKRVAGTKGQKYMSLSPAEKMQIDKRVRQRKNIIQRLAKRLLPAVKRAEMERLKKFRARKQKNEAYVNASFDKFIAEHEQKININTINELAVVVDKFIERIEENEIISEKGYANLVKKGKQYNISIDELFEHYRNGYENPRQGQAPEQSGFLTVNKFIEEGKKRGLWDNIHAKRKRIKAGSGEKMRKPGSKGAPTKQDFKDASEEKMIRLDGRKKAEDTKPKQPLTKYKRSVGPEGEYEVSYKEKLQRKVYNEDDTTAVVSKGGPMDKKKVAKVTKKAEKHLDGPAWWPGKSSANETKGAPKGYHFTRDGKLKKGDADQDGDGGKMLRADPLDKQRKKIPPLPEDTKATDMRQEKEKKNMEIRHARQDAAAKVKQIRRSKVNEAFEINELYFKVEVDGLPHMFIDAPSSQTIKTNLRRLLKRADDSVKSIERVQPAEVRKVFRDRARGKMDNDQVDEEHGAGFIGTTSLRKKYSKETPGQEDAKLAVDGVPTKDGIKKPKV